MSALTIERARAALEETRNLANWKGEHCRGSWSDCWCEDCKPLFVAAMRAAAALCDEWIAARTLTWDARREYLKTADRVAFGSVGIKVDGVRWNACRVGSGGEWFVGTREQATAWLEEQARAAGYEVARG